MYSLTRKKSCPFPPNLHTSIRPSSLRLLTKSSISAIPQPDSHQSAASRVARTLPATYTAPDHPSMNQSPVQPRERCIVVLYLDPAEWRWNRRRVGANSTFCRFFVSTSVCHWFSRRRIWRGLGKRSDMQGEKRDGKRSRVRGRE